VRRREFIKGIAGSAAMARPIAALAREAHRVGVLKPFTQADQFGQTMLSAFRQRLRSLGWNDGQNIRIEERCSGGDLERMQTYADELVS
jgi:putative ABC transport system substrate-binding protein